MKKQHEKLHHRNITTRITSNNIKQIELILTKDNSTKQKYKMNYHTKYKPTINKNLSNKININIMTTNNINQRLPTRKIIMITNTIPLNLQQHKLQPRSQQKYSGNHYSYVSTIQPKTKSNTEFRTLKNLLTSTVLSCTVQKDSNQKLPDTNKLYEYKYKYEYTINEPLSHYQLPSVLQYTQINHFRNTRLKFRNTQKNYSNTGTTTDSKHSKHIRYRNITPRKKPQNPEKLQNTYNIPYDTQSNIANKKKYKNSYNTGNITANTKNQLLTKISNYNRNNSRNSINQHEYYQKSYEQDKHTKYKHRNSGINKQNQDSLKSSNTNYYKYKIQKHHKYSNIPNTIEKVHKKYNIGHNHLIIYNTLIHQHKSYQYEKSQSLKTIITDYNELQLENRATTSSKNTKQYLHYLTHKKTKQKPSQNTTGHQKIKKLNNAQNK
jgi:hypothetical protein